MYKGKIWSDYQLGFLKCYVDPIIKRKMTYKEALLELDQCKKSDSELKNFTDSQIRNKLAYLVQCKKPLEKNRKK